MFRVLQGYRLLLLALFAVGVQGSLSFGEVRTSADYSIQADTPYQAGGPKTSAAYTLDQGIGGPVGVSLSSAPTSTVKHSYIGQLYDIEEVILSANPTTVLERTTRQVQALGVFDDGSVGPIPGTINWSIGGFPLDSVDAFGTVLAASVATQTHGQVFAVVDNVSGQLGLMVLNNPQLFSNVTPHVSILTNSWTFNFLQGTYQGSFTITHTNPEALELSAPFWYVAQSNANHWIQNPTGIHPSNGYPYVDFTAQVLAQQPDQVLTSGESITVTGIHIFSWFLTQPDGFEEQIWSDAFALGGGGTDTDNDGMPDAWEMANGLNYLDPNDAHTDADNDRVSNLGEYLANSNPQDAGSFTGFTSIAPDASGTNLVLTWVSFSSRVYTVYWTTNFLGHGSDVPLATGIPSTPPLNIYTDTQTRALGFTNLEFKVWAQP